MAGLGHGQLEEVGTERSMKVGREEGKQEDREEDEDEGRKTGR